MTQTESVRQSLIEIAVEEYFRAREQGELIDRESFLRKHADIADDLAVFLEGDRLLGSLARSSAHRPSNHHCAGEIIGRYTLVKRIGAGGMGEVWVARQSEPVKREVALKLIIKGMDSESVLARFEQERQALALMDHPNIAKVHDAGVADDGRPYFVMEYVKGMPITDYCDARRLTPPARLELFVSVCHAIQHAHQKGIIHRDIKPSNVLVALYDGRPVVKVIDFGVAKATIGALTEATIETGFGVVGTPQYMSPEQATLNNLDIDTRSDVYALGVLLYELLTGSPPFSRKELARKGLLEILRMVREEEPPRPSTKLSTAEALPTLSANRGTEPRKLTGLLRSELDWIVMKALEKDRVRRYETANGFAADVRRYLAGEAVHAHPPSAAYRMTKFVRRYRVQVIAAGLVFGTLAAGVVGTTLGMLEARKQESNANAAAELERKATLRVIELLDGIVEDYRNQLGTAAFKLEKTRWATALTYLNDRSFAKAEPICRELLAIVEKHRSRSGVWTQFQVRSMLGAALSGQKKFSEAEPLLLTGYNGLKQHENWSVQHDTQIPGVIDRLIELYTETNKPNEASKWRAERAKYPHPEVPWRSYWYDIPIGTQQLLDKILDDARQEHAFDEGMLAFMKLWVGCRYLELKSFEKAETPLREYLSLLDKAIAQADALPAREWEHFQVRSMLGGALLGQGKFAEAESLLLAGYSGLKEREQWISHNDAPIPEAIDRLIEFYTATNKSTEVKKWRAERAKYPATVEPWRPTHPLSAVLRGN